jgi:glutamine amidotransferase
VTRVAIVDYGLGNLFSVERAFRVAGAEAFLTSDPRDLESADAVVFPGVGAFGEGITNLERLGLAEEIKRLAAAGKPTFGICLGMQLLMDSSEEHGHWAGLGLLRGRVVELEPSQPGTKVPQIGWNSIDAAERGDHWSHGLVGGIEPGAFVYFVHSFGVVDTNPGDTLAATEYGGFKFTSIAHHGNVMGCQFHPEKSAEVGLAVIRNFLALVSA